MLFVYLSLFAEGVMSETIKLSGQLVYSAGGNDISLIELNNLKHSSLDSFSTDSINNFTRLSAHAVIFEDCDGLREPNCLLKEFDSGTKSLNTLRSGQLPTYVPESNMLLFYEQDEVSREGWLYIADIRTPNNSRKVAKAPSSPDSKIGWFYYVRPVIQISPNNVLLVGEDFQIWNYDISLSVLNPTGIKNCLPQFIRSYTQQLICYDTKTRDVYQVDLKSQHVELLPQLKGAHGFVYIPKYDTVIYGKTRLYMLMFETSDIWAYDFNKQEKVKIKSKADIASGVWLEE
jgi:hypothetical protein